MRYIIVNTKFPGLAWSNEFGWIPATDKSVDVFNETEKQEFNLPFSGQWAALDNKQVSGIGADAYIVDDPIISDIETARKEQNTEVLYSMLRKAEYRCMEYRGALSWIAGACDVPGACPCGRPNGLPAIKSHAERALRRTK